MDCLACEDAVSGGGGLGDDGGYGGSSGFGGSGFGDGEGVDVFDDAHTDGSDAGGGGWEGQASEGRHDEGGRSSWRRRWCFDLFGNTDEEADARTLGAGGVGAGGLGEDDAGFAGRGDVGDDAELEPEAADIDGGGSLGLADDVGNGNLLRAEAFGDAYSPLAADDGAWSGRLGEDSAGGYVGGVETVFEVDVEAEGTGLFACVGEGEAGEIGDRDLAAVDGEAHGREGGGECDHEHGEGAENEVEGALHG